MTEEIKNTETNELVNMDMMSVANQASNAIVEISDKINTILSDIPLSLSRIETVIDKPFKVIDEKNIAKIKKRSKEINEKMYNFSRGDSQTTRKLMTLQMLHSADSTYRVLRDILANIERKEQALTENILRMKKNESLVNSLFEKMKKTEDINEKKLIENKITNKTISLSNSLSYVEAAIKELGFLQDCYEQIKKNKNIPDDWSEYDFEKAEIKAHIRNAFRLCIRDHMVHGRIGMGTIEYFEQFGISPIEAVYHVKFYLESANQKINKYHDNLNDDYTTQNLKDHLNEIPDYDDFHGFLNKMADLYEKHYIKACKRLGIDDEIISSEFILTNVENKKYLENKSDE